MRERVRKAGLPGLHIGACAGPINRPGIESLKRAGFDSVTAYNYVGTGVPASQIPYAGICSGTRRSGNRCRPPTRCRTSRC